jgi:hypothetical protein
LTCDHLIKIFIFKKILKKEKKKIGVAETTPNGGLGVVSGFQPPP